MKVGIIQNVTLNDHRSVHSHYVACEFMKRGIEVDLILQKTDEKLQYTNVPYNLIQLPGDTYSIQGQIAFAAASLPLIKNKNYDIIHAKNPFSSIFSAVLLKKMGRITSKIVYDMRGLWIDFGVMSNRISPHLEFLLKKTEALLLRECDLIVAISPTLKEVLCSRGIDEKKICVIFGDGVDIEKVESIPPSAKDRDVSVIGYVGTISVSRHSNKIIEAFKEIQKRNLRLVMIGPVVEPHIFESLTSTCTNITLTGFLPQEEAFRRLKSFDIALSYHDTDHPVYNVAVPTKILEYMAAGIPIVATDHPMYTNILEDRKTAVLTKQNPHDFARGIEYFLQNPDVAQKTAARARSEVNKYSVKCIADQLEAAYLRII